MNKINVSINELLPIIESAFSKHQPVTIRIKGKSMEPIFKDGETNVTLIRFPGTLRKKHIYIYKYNDTVILHRYIKTKNNIHYFRGDNQYCFEFVSIDDVVGCVVGSSNSKNVYGIKNTIKSIIRRVKVNIKHYIKKLLRG